MKIIAIGDTHGHDNWKKIVQQDFDKVIFIGDYFDSFDIPFEQQMQNFKEIIAFKEANVGQVVLLIGNHDYHYIMANTHYSGYQSVHETEIRDALTDAIDTGKMQMASYDEGWLFTHAGVTETWAKNAYIDLKNIEGSLNKTFMYAAPLFKFMEYQNADSSGNNTYQSPIWVRPKSLTEDAVKGFKQVVGHTRMKKMSVTDDFIFIDTLDHSGEYLVIQDGEPMVFTPK